MRTALLFLVLLAAGSALAGPASPETKQNFQDAYQSYEKLSGEPRSEEVDQALVEAAKSAYLYGKEVFGDKNKNTALLAQNYAWSLGRVRKGDEGRKVLVESLPIFEAAFGANSKEYMLVHLDIVEFSGWAIKDTVSYAQQAQALSQNLFGENSVDYADALMRLGRDLGMKDFRPLAMEYLEKAKEIYLARLEKDHPLVGSVNYLLGKSYHFDKHHSKALELLLESIRIYETMGAEGLEPAKLAHQLIVKTHYDLEKPVEATRHCIAIGVINEKLGKSEPEIIIQMQRDYSNYVLEKEIIKRGKSAYVTVEYGVSDEGYATNPKVVESTDPLFNNGALATAASGRFAPKVVAGKPVSVEGKTTRIHMGKDAFLEDLDKMKAAVGGKAGD